MAENTPNGSSKVQELYNFLTQIRKEEGNLPLLDKSEVGKDANDFANKLQDQNFSKTIFDFLTIPKPEEGNIPLLDKSEIGNDMNGFLKTFVPQKKNPIGFESSNGSVPSPLTSSMYAPMQGMGEKTEKQVKNAPLVSSAYAPVAGMGMAPTGGVAEFGKYLYNKLLSGAGGVAAGTTDFITQAATPTYIPKDATAIVVRNTITPYLRNYLGETIGAKQSKEQKKLYDDDFVKGSIGGLAESVPAMLTGVPGLFAQAYDSSLQSINNSKFANDLSETEKSMFALSVGGVSSVLEKYGLDKIFTKSKAFNAFSDKLTGLIIDRLASQGVKITSKILSQEASNVVNNITKKAIKSGIRITDAALVEGLTGGSQEVATIGIEEIANKYKGKEIFDNGSMGNMMGRVIKAAGQEAIGGGIMGGFASVISGDLTDKRTLVSVASAPNSAEAIPVIVDEIKKQAESNQITKDEAGQALEYLNLSATNNFKIPDNISEEKRSEALEILNEKTVLEDLLTQREAAAANLDPAFKDTKATEIADIKAQIEEKNQLLKSIGNGEALIVEENKPTDISFGTAFEIQDATAEETVGKNKEAWGNAGVYRERIENAGDILRELSSRGENPDPTYLLEKVDKIRKWIDNNRKNPSEKIPNTINTLEDFQKSDLRFTNTIDSYDYLLKFHSDILNKAKSEYESIPSYTKEQRLAIDLTLDLINNNIEGLESKLNEIESIANKIKEQGKLEIVPDITPIKSELTTKPTEDATKISKEPITEGVEQGDIVQRERTQEGQPQEGQGEGGTGETTQPEADNRNRPISSEEEVITRQPKNIKELYSVNRELFGLDRLKSVASAIAMDRMIGAMAERAGISKTEMYSKLKFEKTLEENLPQGVKMQVDAWHGSPYQFDKFTTEKIGTGEGAQAFGWGLYFTDIKGIADSYARKLSGDKFLYDGKDISENAYYYLSLADDPLFDIEWDENRIKELSRIAIDKINKEYIPDFEDIQKTSLSEKQRNEEMPNRIKEAKNVINELKNIIQSNNIIKSKNKNVYKVSLHEGKTPEQYIWLEWDKPLSDKIKNKIIDFINSDTKYTNPTFTELKRKIKYNLENDFITDGEDLYKYNIANLSGLNQKNASEFLLDAGIDGVKYPAQSISRGATSDNAKGFNYVVFDENAVSIQEAIKFQRDANKARGAAMVAMDGQAVIYALTDPNVSTPLHELAHVFEHYLTDAEKNIIIKNAGTEGWTIETSEYFARGFETYLSEGKSPVKELNNLFDKFKNWLLDIYSNIKESEIDIKLNENMRKIYDSMLSATPEEEVIQESKQEPVKKRAFIDMQEIEDKYPNLYESLMNGDLRYSGAKKFTIFDIRNLLVQAGKKFFEDAGSATDYLNTQIDIENILETLYEPLAENVTKEQFKQKLVESKDFTKNELGIFNALIDTLSIDQMPIYLLNKGDIKRISSRVNANFYSFAKNLIVSKEADAFVHEIGHFAYYNILSKEDRINYLKYMISTTYDTPNSKGKSIASRLAYTSEDNIYTKNGRTYQLRTNVGDNFSEYFAEQFSQWYLNKKVFPKDIEYIFRKVKDIISKVIEKLISGKYVDENLSDYFNKIIGEVDKIRKENKPIGEAKPEVPTQLTKLEEKYNQDKKSLTKKELNEVLDTKRERRKKAMASLEKGNLSEEEVAIKKAAMQKLTDTMVEIIAAIDTGKFKKTEADKEPTIKQKIKAGTEGGTTKTKAMTFSEYMRDRKRSFEEGYKKGTKDRAAQEQYRKAMLNVAIEYLTSKKLGKLKEAALRSLIKAASRVSNMSKLETFIKRVDLIMAKADFIEKYNEAKTLKKDLDTNKKGGATQLIQRFKNINLDYLPESGIDKVIAIAKELNSKRPDMSTVIPNMKEVLDLEEAGFREAMRANYGELGLLGGSISKFMDNEEIYKNLKKLIEYQLISKEQVAEVELENAKTVLRNKLEEAYKKIKDFVDNKKTIDNLGEYLDIKKAIKAYNRTVRQIDQVMPEFAQKFELLTDADNEISQRLGKEIETALKEFKEEVIKVSLNTSANLREYALSDAFKEESGLSPELNEILSNHLANFANNMDRETMNDLSVEDIADYTFFAEQALLGYISPEIYETYSKVGAIKAKNDTMQDLESVMESDSKLQRDIAKINANYKGAKKTEDFVKIMTEYRKHNVDSFLGSGAVSLFYNNVYFPFGTNVTRMRTIIADLTSDFIKLDDEMNGISLSYGIPRPKMLGGKKVISSTQIGKLLGSDKSIEDVKNTIMILLQQLDFINNIENPDKAKEKVYFESFIKDETKREAIVNDAKDKQGMRDLFQNYENAIEIISKLQKSINNKNKTLSEKAAGLITGKTAETLSKATDAGVTLETITGVEEILNELGNSNPIVKAYIDVIRKTIASFEAYTEMNTMMKGEQYYSLPNYMPRQYVSGNLNTVSTSDKTAQLLSGRELYQRIKKNSSATYSREGDGLKPRIIDPKAALMMHANDVMMEYSLKGIMEASLDGIALAQQQATTKGEKNFLAACKESMNLMLETEFVTSRAEGLPKMASEILNLQTTLLVGNSLRQPADYIGNVSKVATSVEGAKVFINNIAEKLGTLQFLENGNSNLKELQERDKAAYELASMLGGELLWSEMEKKASQASGNIGGEQIMGNKTIKLAWADRLIVSNVYLPLFIKYFEQSAKKKFDPKEFNENPQKYYLDNLKALQVATKEADKYISKTQVSKNPLTKPEIVSLLGFKLKRDALFTRLLFSLTGYNANDSEVIKSILMDLYHGNGNRGLKLAQLSSRVSRSAVSNVVYMSIYKIIFGTLAVLIQSGIGFFDDDDDKEFAKLLVKEWDEFYQQYLTKEGLQQDLLGSFATMLTGQYQNIVRPVVNAGLFAAMKAGLLGDKTKMSEDKYKKIIRSTRSANFFTKQYAPKYEVGTVVALEAAGVLGLSYTASMAGENVMAISNSLGKAFSDTEKNTNIDFIAVTTAALQLANASAMIMGSGYGSGTYNKVYDQVKREVREEQRKQKPSKVQSIQSVLRAKPAMKKFNPLKP